MWYQLVCMTLKCDAFSFYDCRDNYEATPMDRLSEEEKDYQEIVACLTKHSIPPEEREPVDKQPSSKVRVYHIFANTH